MGKSMQRTRTRSAAGMCKLLMLMGFKETILCLFFRSAWAQVTGRYVRRDPRVEKGIME